MLATALLPTLTLLSLRWLVLHLLTVPACFPPAPTACRRLPRKLWWVATAAAVDAAAAAAASPQLSCCLRALCTLMPGLWQAQVHLQPIGCRTLRA